MNFRTYLKNNKLVSQLFFNFKLDIIKDYKYAMCGLQDALSTFLTAQERENTALVSEITKDIKRSYWHTLTTPEEYFLCEFRNIEMNKRKDFLTDNFLVRTLKMEKGDFVRNDRDLEDKAAFARKMKEYMNRPFVEVKQKSDYPDFLEMALFTKNLFFKPNYSSRGSGIFTAIVNNEEEANHLFTKMMELGGTWLVEQRIEQNAEMAKWNESSVNTIRYYSFLDNNHNYNVLPHALRTGRKGCIVDNACNGGIFATVDPETGKIYTDGIDRRGIRYKKHPDSGIVYEGWQIPQWEELCSIVKEAHEKCLSNHHYIGWDWALTDTGWVLIEANWGQMIPQYCLKRGFKNEFLKYIGKY